MIRLVVVDDHLAVRRGFAAYLDAHHDVEVVGEGADGHEALELVRELAPDVVLMDIRMPVLDGIRATAMIKAERRLTRVVLVTAYEEDELTDAGREAGADALAFKGILGRELLELIRAVAAGNAHAEMVPA